MLLSYAYEWYRNSAANIPIIVMSQCYLLILQFLNKIYYSKYVDSSGEEDSRGFEYAFYS